MTALDEAATRRAEVTRWTLGHRPVEALCPVCGVEYRLVGKDVPRLARHGPVSPALPCPGSGAFVRDDA